MRRRQRRPIILNVFTSRVYRKHIHSLFRIEKLWLLRLNFKAFYSPLSLLFLGKRQDRRPTRFIICILYCSFNLCLLESVVEFLLFFVVQRVPVLWWERERRVTTTRRWSRGFFLLSLPRNRLPRRHTHVRLKRVRERERKPKPHLIGNNERRR